MKIEPEPHAALWPSGGGTEVQEVPSLWQQMARRVRTGLGGNQWKILPVSQDWFRCKPVENPASESGHFHVPQKQRLLHLFSASLHLSS